MTIIAKAVYDKYVALHAEVETIRKDVLEPHVCVIIQARHCEKPAEGSLRFTKDYVFYENEYGDCSGRIPAELLFDENWEATVRAELVKREKLYEADRVRIQRERAAADEAKERGQLAELLKKYPDMARSG